MNGQQSIPVPDSPAPEGPCEWCGDPDTVPFVVRPASWGKAANGIRVLKRRALVVPACRRHAIEFGQNPYAGDE